MPPPQLLGVTLHSFAATSPNIRNGPSCQISKIFELPKNAREPHIGPHTHYAGISAHIRAPTRVYVRLKLGRASLPAGLRPAGSLALNLPLTSFISKKFSSEATFIFFIF